MSAYGYGSGFGSGSGSSSSAGSSSYSSSSGSDSSSSSSSGASASSSPSSSSTNVAVTASSVVIGLLLLIAVAVLIIKYIRKSKMKKAANASPGDLKITQFLEDLSTENPKRFTSQQLLDITAKYSKELGAGGFGRVYEGKLKLRGNSEMLVAVKLLNASANSSIEEQFIAEVGTMCRTNHINLVKLYGFCFEAGVKALVFEYMENGSLDKYLSGKKGWLEFDKLYEIAIGTARGIRYLHDECQKKIIHYDIKPANVLLSSNLTPKVGDFGLAELMDRDIAVSIITHGKGTPGFVAPEVMAPQSFSHKSDIYSFGMFLFEILGSRRNMEDRRDESQEWSPRWVWEKVSKGEAETILSHCGINEKDRTKAERMCKVALMCIRYQPESRPSMSSVLMMLEGKEEAGATVSPFNSLVSSNADSKAKPIEIISHP